MLLICRFSQPILVDLWISLFFFTNEWNVSGTSERNRKSFFSFLLNSVLFSLVWFFSYIVYDPNHIRIYLFFLFFSSVTSFYSSARDSSASLFSHGTIANSIDYCE